MSSSGSSMIARRSCGTVPDRGQSIVCTWRRFAPAAAFPDNGANATRDQLAAFVNQYFLTAGSDTVAWVPDDYEWQPPLLMTVGNATLRNFTLSLNDLWLHLGRQIIDAVRTTPQRFSLVWQPHPMIVPGGRFLER